MDDWPVTWDLGACSAWTSTQCSAQHNALQLPFIWPASTTPQHLARSSNVAMRSGSLKPTEKPC